MSNIGKAVREIFEDMEDPIAAAATATMRDAADDFKDEVRFDIAAAGFSNKWANAWRVNVYPRGRRDSIEAAIYGYHKIGYAGVFETGATIRGQPDLWVPLTTTPRRIGRRKMSPENYRRSIGPLIQIENPGKPKMLFGAKAGASRSRGGKHSLSSLRRGASIPPSRAQMVPLFVAVPSVDIHKRFHVSRIARSVVNRLPSLYAKHFARG